MYALSDYDYCLPKRLIAQKPAARRDRSRLLWLEGNSDRIHHRRFDDLVQLLQPGDVLVVNDTAVVPARIMGRKATGGKVEVLLLNYPGKTSSANPSTITFQCLIKASKRPTAGTRLIFKKGVTAVVTGFTDGIFEATFSFTGNIDENLGQIGSVPLPPYINRDDPKAPCDDSATYQTVYARNMGAVAAPTAGLHFTPELLQNLKIIGVKIVPITLHVGYGTFSPVRVDDIRDHHIHTEPYRIPKKTAKTINNARVVKHRIIAVGTTSCRTLEYATNRNGHIVSGAGMCNLFIYPGYRFKMTDALITNFHLPQSTLLMLVSALAGRDRVLAAYREAIQTGYRFYSYGDAMFIG